MLPEQDITFGTSGLDRGGRFRTEPEELAALRAKKDASGIALWRGKPMMRGDTLAWLPLEHPVFLEAPDDEVFLGLHGEEPRFAMDVSGWEPETDVEGLDSFLDTSSQSHPSVPDDHEFLELRGVMTRLDRRDAELAATARAILSWHSTHRFCSKCGAESKVAQGGWQRVCPACNGMHFPRTDPVVIMLITLGNNVLVGRSPQWPDRMYSLLAGFVEPGETIEAAVRREVLEEAGIEVGRVSYLASQPWPYPSSLMFGCSGEALSDKIEIDPVEIEDAIWVSREEMVDVFAGTHPKMREPRRGAIAHSLLRAWLAGTTESL
jgi:NAD+ diphosphatase